MLLFRFDMAIAAYAGPRNHLTHGTPLFLIYSKCPTFSKQF